MNETAWTLEVQFQLFNGFFSPDLILIMTFAITQVHDFSFNDERYDPSNMTKFEPCNHLC